MQDFDIKYFYEYTNYRKVLPIRPGLDPKWLGIKTPFSKSIGNLKKNYGQISISGLDLDPEKIEKFWSSNSTFFTKKALKSLYLNLFSIFINQFVLFFILHNNKYSVNNNNQNIFFKLQKNNLVKKNIRHTKFWKKSKKLSPVLISSHLGSSPGLIDKTLR